MGRALEEAHFEEGGGDHKFGNCTVDRFEDWGWDDEEPAEVPEDREHKCVDHDNPFWYGKHIAVRVVETQTLGGFAQGLGKHLLRLDRAPDQGTEVGGLVNQWETVWTGPWHFAPDFLNPIGDPAAGSEGREQNGLARVECEARDVAKFLEQLDGRLDVTRAVREHCDVIEKTFRADVAFFQKEQEGVDSNDKKGRGERATLFHPLAHWDNHFAPGTECWNNTNFGKQSFHQVHEEVWEPHSFKDSENVGVVQRVKGFCEVGQEDGHLRFLGEG